MEEYRQPTIRIEDLPQELSPEGMTAVTGSGGKFFYAGAALDVTALDDWEARV
ncbi:MAG: hypothetical protein HY319_15080 [Armatimonadetes bacterium]|nr:hypothetical protein [Armatimonadota bacterium]